MNEQHATPNYANTETLNPADISVWQLYRQRFWPLLLLSLIVLVIATLFKQIKPSEQQIEQLVTYILYLIQGAPRGFTLSINPGLVWQVFACIVIGLAAIFLLNPLLYGSAMQILFAQLEGRKQSIAQAWRALRGQWRSVFLLNLVDFLLGLALVLLLTVGCSVLILILGIPMGLFSSALPSILLGLLPAAALLWGAGVSTVL